MSEPPHRDSKSLSLALERRLDDVERSIEVRLHILAPLLLSEPLSPMDRVDHAMIARPRHWDLAIVRHFMFVLGPLSSIFDFLTFGLLRVFGAGEALFAFLRSMVLQWGAADRGGLGMVMAPP